jgi:uncharacterized damage-inducible protein DinB
MRGQRDNPRVGLILRMFDDGYNKTAWHGPNLRGAIRRVDAATAAWRPAAERKSIAEIAVHCAYWKYAAWRRLTGEKRGSFPLKGSNWFAVEAPLGEAAWKEHQRLLDRMHASLREAIVSLSDADLAKVTPGARTSNEKLLYGIAMHDVYHAGQIQTLKRLCATE